MAAATLVEETPATVGAFADNPLYNLEKMGSAVEHANSVTRSYGIEIMSINIISADFHTVDYGIDHVDQHHPGVRRGGVGRGPHGRDNR